MTTEGRRVRNLLTGVRWSRSLVDMMLATASGLGLFRYASSPQHDYLASGDRSRP